MQILHKISIDMVKKSSQPVVYGMQSDANSRAVEVSLFSDSVPWVVPSDAFVSVAFKNKANGHKGWYDKLPNGDDACTVNGNVVTAILAPAVLSGDGEVQAAIVFQDANLNQLATFGFSILVEKNPAAGSFIANDYYAYSTMEEINDAIAQVRQEAGAAIINDATGEVVAVSDASDRPLQGLTLYGKTTQNGTPTPDAPVPLVSAGDGGSIGVKVTGKNILVNTASNLTGNGVTFTVNDDKSITTSGTSTADIYYAVTLSTPLSAGEYFLSGIPQGASGMRIYVWPGYYSDMGNGCPFSVEENGMYEAYIHIDSGVNCNGLTFRPQIEVGTSATAYEPYKEQSLTISTPNGLPGIPVSYGGNYTDSNGQQWVCDEIDLARGVYVQRVMQTTLDGSEGWSQYALGGDREGASFIHAPKNAKIGYNLSLCDAYRNVNGAWDHNFVGSLGIYSDHSLASNKYFRPPNSSITTVEQWIAWLAENPLQFIYVMETPTETPLDADTLAAYAALHTNKPNTTVTNDAGAGQKVAYVADTKTYIDQKFTQLQSAIIAAIGTI